MANKDKANLDDNALKNVSGGYIYHKPTVGMYYSVDDKGNILAESKNLEEIEAYNDEHNISNKFFDDRDTLWKLKDGLNPFSKDS